MLDRVHVRLPTGATVSVRTDGISSVRDLKRRVLDEAGARGGVMSMSVERCRLLFAGRELDDALSLLDDYNLAQESEIHILLRELSDADLLQRQFRGKDRLEDYEVLERIGGKDIGQSGGHGYSMSGVCSYVYRARLQSGDGTPLALKVMINLGSATSVQIGREFEAERAVLLDPGRLPQHPNIICMLHSFTDNVHGRLPGWDFDPSLVAGHTLVLVMPFHGRDLKTALKSARKTAAFLAPARAARIGKHMLQAVQHLKIHGVAHRDIKTDNILLNCPGTEEERAVLSDFGMCFDLRKNRVRDFRVMLPYDGFRRGGAPITISPEVSLPEPGPNAVLNYEKNDEWAVGMVLHEILSPDGSTPFPDIDHPGTYSDTNYIPVRAPVCAGLAAVVRSLLRVDVCERSAAEDAVTQIDLWAYKQDEIEKRARLAESQRLRKAAERVARKQRQEVEAEVRRQREAAEAEIQAERRRQRETTRATAEAARRSRRKERYAQKQLDRVAAAEARAELAYASAGRPPSPARAAVSPLSMARRAFGVVVCCLVGGYLVAKITFWAVTGRWSWQEGHCLTKQYLKDLRSAIS
jgi:serine/threonine protein kinase